MRCLRAAALGALVAGAAWPHAAGARLLVLPPAAPRQEQTLALTALRCAAAAEASGLSADLADWPGRAELAVGRSASAAFEAAVPEPLRARAGAWRERAALARATFEALASAGAALDRWSARAGGLAAAADRVLDAAALLTAAAVALRFALRPRATPPR